MLIMSLMWVKKWSDSDWEFFGRSQQTSPKKGLMVEHGWTILLGDPGQDLGLVLQSTIIVLARAMSERCHWMGGVSECPSGLTIHSRLLLPSPTSIGWLMNKGDTLRCTTNWCAKPTPPFSLKGNWHRCYQCFSRRHVIRISFNFWVDSVAFQCPLQQL